MGGRLDATNAVLPLISVITTIALDHRQWLGNTIAEIAQEKAGIIKPGTPVVSAAQDAPAAEVLEAQAGRLNSELTFVTSPMEGIPISLRGAHQKANAALALEAVTRAGFPLEDHVVREAMANVRWPGRFQIVDQRIVLDGAHNPHAAQNLVRIWREMFGQQQPLVILGVLEDKDYPVIIEKLEPIASEFYFVPVKSFRSATTEQLTAACMIKYTVFESVQEALAASRGLTLVTGSLFLVGEVMGLLGIEP
jgi:dihydrofolate synthase/folylpolyglutamate synthase